MLNFRASYVHWVESGCTIITRTFLSVSIKKSVGLSLPMNRLITDTISDHARSFSIQQGKELLYDTDVLVLLGSGPCFLKLWEAYISLYSASVPLKFMHYAPVDTPTMKSVCARHIRQRGGATSLVVIDLQSLFEVLSSPYIMTSFNDDVFREGELTDSPRIVIHYDKSGKCDSVRQRWNSAVNTYYNVCEFRASTRRVADLVIIGAYPEPWKTHTEIPFIFLAKRAYGNAQEIKYVILREDQVGVFCPTACEAMI